MVQLKTATVCNISRQREIPRRRADPQSPQLFATSAMAGGAEAHPHIAPPKLPLSTLRRPLPLTRGLLGEVLYRCMG
jgi:hypothetical protein